MTQNREHKIPPLVVIIGPTASGKTAVAIRLAKKYKGEIICADSRTIYRGLDIGTAKPTLEERREVPHWGLDLAEPGERYTAAQFKRYALERIKDIRARGSVPFLVGGTGLYVDAVVYDYDFPPEPTAGDRSNYDNMPLEQLHDYCMKNNIKLPENYKNKRHVVNAILRSGVSLKRRSAPLENTYVVGIATNKSELDNRIRARARLMWESGVIKEAQVAAEKYGWNREAMTGNIYPLVRKVIAGELSRADAEERFAILDRQLAKRQVTWFKRDKHIQWMPLDEVYTYCAHLLDSVNKL